MYGDRLLLYNTKTGKFFVYASETWSMKRGGGTKVVWTEDIECAWSTSTLRSIHEKKAKLGADVKIVTETQAKRIVEMRALDDEYRAAQRKPRVLLAER